jgi:hypothetical protein
MQKLIEQLIKEEIQNIIGELSPIIDSQVKQHLNGELRTQVRRAIYQSLESSLEEKVTLPVDAVSPDSFSTAQPLMPSPLVDYAGMPGLYIYCVFKEGQQKLPDDMIGLDRAPVRIICNQGLCAALHDCPAAAYQSQDETQVETWVLAHEKVIEGFIDICGTVAPMSFDTIVRPAVDLTADDNLRQWLAENHERLTQIIDRLNGRAEYGVQIFWDKQAATQVLTESDLEIKKIVADLNEQPEGLAYMNRHRIEKLVQQKLEIKADQLFQKMADQIKMFTADMRIEAIKKNDDPKKSMLVNMKCLLDVPTSQALGKALDEIDAGDDLSVSYTGPWPPYSFV